MAVKCKLGADDNETKYTFPEAYFKVWSVSIDANAGSEIIIYVSVYASRDSRINSGKSIDKKIIHASLDEFTKYIKDPIEFTKNGLIAAAYKYLKNKNIVSGEDV